MIAVILPLRSEDRDEAARLAEDFSPRVECGASGVALDASGLSRLFGSAEGLAQEIVRQAEARGLSARIAVAATQTAAAIAAKFIPDEFSSLNSTVIPPGCEREALAPLPLEALTAIDDLIGPALEKAAADAPKRRRKGQGRHYRLAPSPEPSRSAPISLAVDRLQRWGLTSLGDLAALPSAEVSARLGDGGLVLQRAARGEDERPLIPAVPPSSFLQSMQLEWPVDDLQPLAFIVSRLCEALEQALARADRGAIALTTMLRLVTKEAYARTLALPSPMRDARVLRTLVMLDLESHPPGAAIDEVVIDVDVAPGRILQTELFTPALPAPETLSTLVARLGAVAGASRVGSPAMVDTHYPGAFEIKPFAPHLATGYRPPTTGPEEISPASVVSRGSGRKSVAGSRWSDWVVGSQWPDHKPAVIRRFRPPRAARVWMGPGGVQGAPPFKQCPERVEAADIRGAVTLAAGPWRTSGGWWSGGWDRDEWDVSLENGLVCRLAQDRLTKSWVIDGVLD